MLKAKKATPKKRKYTKKAKRPYTKKKSVDWVEDAALRVERKRSELLKRKQDNAEAMYTTLKELRRVVFVAGGEVELMAVALDAVRVLRVIDNDSLNDLFRGSTKGGKK